MGQKCRSPIWLSLFAFILFLAGETIKHIMKNKQDVIIDNLIIYEVNDKLFSAEVLSEKDREDIESVSGLSAQAKRLLQCLLKKGSRQRPESFVKALEDTKQIHLASLCKDDGKMK